MTVRSKYAVDYFPHLLLQRTLTLFIQTLMMSRKGAEPQSIK